ncbi:MAG: histidine kinase N-terminal 7TM domain-containing protein [Candidatus Promineifilaceae bacterium]
MSSQNLLPLINDILQAVIVIFGVSVVLYYLPTARKDHAQRAFSLVLASVVTVFFSELVVSRTVLPGSNLDWLRFKWVGITFVPVAQLHLSDTLLNTTGSLSNRRRILTSAVLLASVAIYLSVFFSGAIVGEIQEINRVAHFQAGPYFILFAGFYGIVSMIGIYNLWRAYKRSITHSTQRRMRIILIAILAAPLSVFPYLGFRNSSLDQIPTWLWLLLIAGNLGIGLMFAQLTTNINYFGSLVSPRVARVKLLKFMARVPMTASIVLLVHVLTVSATRPLGLNPQNAAAITTVATVMLVEWAIHAYKGPLERRLHFNNEPDVRRIQQLSERLITRQDMRQFLESLLSAGCNALRVPTAFVASISAEGSELTAMIGRSSADFENEGHDDLATLPPTNELLASDNTLIRWHDYWIKPLYTRQGEVLVGILGIGVNLTKPLYTEHEHSIVERITAQAAGALEDQLLQQSVFAAVEGLLPAVTALQQLRGAAAFSGAILLEDEVDSAETDSAGLTDDPDFKNMVRDALSHYWGGSKLTESPLLELSIVQNAMSDDADNPIRGLRTILKEAIERQKPDGEQSLTRTEWLLYNILELKFLQGIKVRDIAARLAMSESDLYRKQRIAIENVARAVADMELDNEQLPIVDNQP